MVSRLQDQHRPSGRPGLRQLPATIERGAGIPYYEGNAGSQTDGPLQREEDGGERLHLLRGTESRKH